MMMMIDDGDRSGEVGSLHRILVVQEKFYFKKQCLETL